MDKNKLKSIIESILFIWGDPISLEDLASTLEFRKDYTREILMEMKENYKNETSGLRLREVDGKFQLGTKQENEPYLKNLIKEKNEKNLSKPALETLSIIAYKQPVTKVEVEELRGVNCDRIGHPNLYSTTDKFLQKFGMKNLEDLPDLKELEEESN